MEVELHPKNELLDNVKDGYTCVLITQSIAPSITPISSLLLPISFSSVALPVSASLVGSGGLGETRGALLEA